jgi:hypothetical protein
VYIQWYGSSDAEAVVRPADGGEWERVLDGPDRCVAIIDFHAALRPASGRGPANPSTHCYKRMETKSPESRSP